MNKTEKFLRGRYSPKMGEKRKDTWETPGCGASWNYHNNHYTRGGESKCGMETHEEPWSKIRFNRELRKAITKREKAREKRRLKRELLSRLKSATARRLVLQERVPQADLPIGYGFPYEKPETGKPEKVLGYLVRSGLAPEEDLKNFSETQNLLKKAGIIFRLAP